MKLAVRYFFTTLLFIVFCFLFIKAPAFAQIQIQPQPQPPAVNPYAAPNTNSDVPNNLHNWTQNVMIEVMSAMTCQLVGVDPTNPSAKCLGVDSKTNKIGFVENGGGAVGLMGNLISMTFTPPVHTSDYIAYISRDFGITKHAYAATPCDLNTKGLGFCGLSPLMNLWSAFRNIVYLIFIIVFVIIGLAIMLRVKIDPRTVMTIQNQIPKLIIGILLVTFSFAIAGFLIDIMYISIYLITSVLASADAKITNDVISSIAQATNPFDSANAIAGTTGLGGIIGSSSDSVSNIIGGAFNNPMGRGLFGLIGTIIGAVVGGNIAESIPIIGGLVGGIVGGIVGAVFATSIAGFIAKVIALLIIAIAVLWSLFKLWFILLEAYIMILVHTVFAPFWIVTGLLPGLQSAGFGAWLREILANLAVFPTTIIILLLGRIFIDSFGTTNTPGQFVPPLMGSIGNTNAIGALIGIGIIFLLPNAATITKAAFKAPKIDLGPVGKAVGTGPRVLGGAYGTVMSGLSAKYYLGVSGIFGKKGGGPPAPEPGIVSPSVTQHSNSRGS